MEGEVEDEEEEEEVEMEVVPPPWVPGLLVAMAAQGLALNTPPSQPPGRAENRPHSPPTTPPTLLLLLLLLPTLRRNEDEVCEDHRESLQCLRSCTHLYQPHVWGNRHRPPRADRSERRRSDNQLYGT
ncbi:hypothetical protein CRUP_003420 [Coryphaenoides rupestris]|nr:hypothetical protein CRUP_003420 [Coryphaenoides rupestris]